MIPDLVMLKAQIESDTMIKSLGYKYTEYSWN